MKKITIANIIEQAKIMTNEKINLAKIEKYIGELEEYPSNFVMGELLTILGKIFMEEG